MLKHVALITRKETLSKILTKMMTGKYQKTIFLVLIKFLTPIIRTRTVILKRVKPQKVIQPAEKKAIRIAL